jgi:hypothetical protein
MGNSQIKETSKLVVSCIKFSIQSGGNSRSIIMVIKSAAEVLSVEEIVINKDFFEKWQAISAGKVIQSKFKHASFPR